MLWCCLPTLLPSAAQLHDSTPTTNLGSWDRAPKNVLGGEGGGGGWTPFSKPPRLALFFHTFHAYFKSPPPPSERQAFSLKNIQPHSITTFLQNVQATGTGGGAL